MIVCPNCDHQNPDAAIQCEACYTPLPAMTTCPNCSASVQADASFCGQCGFNLQESQPDAGQGISLPPTVSPVKLPDLSPVEPLVAPDPLPIESMAADPEAEPHSTPNSAQPAVASPAHPISAPAIPPTMAQMPEAPSAAYRTQLQTQVARLLHVQTNTTVELPVNLTVIHLGKPNDRVPPDVDVSGFPNSEIVSRIHADIRIEGDIYYIEDVGSSNGTYVNNVPLPTGNRHRLRPGDRVALGKGDKVTFLFQIS